MVTQPRLLLLDEPPEAIQPSLIKDIEHVIRTLPSAATWQSCSSNNILNLPVTSPARFFMQQGEIVLSGRRADMNESAVLGYLTV